VGAQTAFGNGGERNFGLLGAAYEEEGLTGLADKRLGKASARRAPINEVTWMLGQYRTSYRGSGVKHFHDHLQREHNFCWGYTGPRRGCILGLVERARRRGAHRRKRMRKPCVGMMLHQDGSHFGCLQECRNST
jgi:hypothetical protein